MTKGVYIRTPEMKTGKYKRSIAQRKKTSESNKKRRETGEKFGFQLGHKINLGRKHTGATKEKMKNTRLGKHYKIVSPRKLITKK